MLTDEQLKEQAEYHRQALARLDAQAEPKPGNGKAKARYYLEAAAEFLAGVEEPRVQLVSEILPFQIQQLLHGDVRTRKSWGAMEQGIALATGTPAFGMDRFKVPCALPVLLCSQEDARRMVRDRARRLLRGRGLEVAPDTLHFACHAGIDLLSERWQETLIEDTLKLGIKLVVFDPIRRFAVGVDKGPAEVAEITAFLRRLTMNAECSVSIVHHDTKPAKDGVDTRRRGHRASGGDWFAASECPIALEAAGRNTTLCVPEDFKEGAESPAAFQFHLEEGDAWVRVVGENVNAEDVGAVALHARVLEFLSNTPGASGTAVSKGVRVRKESVLVALEELSEAGKVDSVMKGRARSWFLSPS